MKIKSFLFLISAMALTGSLSIERLNCAENAVATRPATCIACKKTLVNGKCPNCAKCKTCKKSLNDCKCPK